MIADLHCCGPEGDGGVDVGMCRDAHLAAGLHIKGLGAHFRLG